MSAMLTVARAVVRLAAWLAPRDGRAAWVEEWEADLWHLWYTHGAHGSRGRRLASHVLGAIPHAFTARLESMRLRMTWQDVRYAVRSVAGGGTTTLVSILTLALGTGATGTVFTLLDGVVLRPLSYPASERLVAVNPDAWLSGRMFRFLESEATSYDAMAAWAPSSQTLQIETASETLLGPRVTDKFFTVLGQPARAGRTFVEGEDEPGHSVVLISHDLWRRRFAGQPDVIGRRIQLSGVSRTIVGILPPGFDAIQPGADIVFPATLDPTAATYDFQNLRTVVARLAPGVTRDAAEAELRLLTKRWGEQAGWDPDRVNNASVISLHEFVVGDVRPTILLLFGAVACTLLIVVANVTSLQLAHTLRRRHEFALRLALGARPSRLAAQLIAETTLIAMAATLVGMVLVVTAVPTLVSLFPGDLPRSGLVHVNGITLLFTGAVGLLAGWLIAAVPVAHAIRTSREAGLGSGPRSATASRSRRVVWSSLVAAEVALALTLLISGGLFIKSFRRTLEVDPGFASDGVATVLVRPAPGALGTTEALEQYHTRMAERLAAISGVEASAGALAVPILEPGWWFGIHREEFPPGPNEDWPMAHWRPVTREYFGTTGVRLLQGRGFEPTDRMDAPPVAVITQHTAEQWFEGEDPIGRRLVIGVERGATGPVTVVGVVENVRYIGLRDPPVPTVYRPWPQAAPALFRIGVRARYAVLRTSGDPASLAPSVAAAIHEVDPGASIGPARTMQDVISASVAESRAIILLLGFFATASLVLGALGVYGVMAFTVGQRAREMSIRLALGATGSRVLRRILTESLRLIGAGVAVGLVLTVVLTRLLERFLFRVAATDPEVFGGAVALLTVVGLLAAYIPGRRAARAAPIGALRGD